jgi:hypothetical protein
MTSTQDPRKLQAPTRCIRRTVRVRKQDSAFVYCILESHEGIASYSTLAHEAGAAHRDLELQIPPDFAEDVERVLKQLGEMIYELRQP